MRTRALCLVAVAALLAGCGSDKGARRNEVDSYIERVNDVMRHYKGSVAAANDAYKNFSASGTKKELRRLHAAEAAILSMRTELRRLDPAPDAKRLHRDLLRLVDLELAVATGATEFAEFVPTAHDALTGVGKTNARFRQAFSAATTAAEQQTVFSRYSADLSRNAAALSGLAPPPSLEPWQHAEVARLQRTARSARSLAEALASKDRAAIDAAVAAFSKATSVTEAELRAQRRAIIQYDQQVVRVSRAAAQVQRDRDRLQQKLG